VRLERIDKLMCEGEVLDIHTLVNPCLETAFLTPFASVLYVTTPRNPSAVKWFPYTKYGTVELRCKGSNRGARVFLVLIAGRRHLKKPYPRMPMTAIENRTRKNPPTGVRWLMEGVRAFEVGMKLKSVAALDAGLDEERTVEGTEDIIMFNEESYNGLPSLYPRWLTSSERCLYIRASI
jgi:hypothetical protein